MVRREELAMRTEKSEKGSERKTKAKCPHSSPSRLVLVDGSEANQSEICTQNYLCSKQQT